jgi:hypothetical protein
MNSLLPDDFLVFAETQAQRNPSGQVGWMRLNLLIFQKTLTFGQCLARAQSYRLKLPLPHLAGSARVLLLRLCGVRRP